MAKRGILREALEEAAALKEAALKNAENSLAGHFRESLEHVISAQLNEEAEEDESEECVEEADVDGLEGDTMTEEEGFDFESLGDEDESGEPDGDEEGGDDLDFLSDDDGDEELEEGLGFTEADLQEALHELLGEVSHGSLGEPQDVTDDKHDTGLMDQDSKAAGWETKTAPDKKDWTMKESRLKKSLVQALTENRALKKAMKKLKEAVTETNLFNRKMFYAHKLLGKSGLNEQTKMKIVKRLDKARTVREAAGIYESIEMALGVVSESAAPRQSRKSATLSEALGRQVRTEKGVSHVDDAHLLSEDARYATRRMQVLAGIIQSDDE